MTQRVYLPSQGKVIPGLRPPECVLLTSQKSSFAAAVMSCVKSSELMVSTYIIILVAVGVLTALKFDTNGNKENKLQKIRMT